MKFTLALFRQLVENVPPLFPEDLKRQIRNDVKNFQDGDVSLEEVEKKMIEYGYKIWPWNQAFNEIITNTEETVGEQFLLANLSEVLQEKYLEFKKLGLSLKDFHAGKAANYFDEEQRIELGLALVNMRLQVREFATREVVGLKKKYYLKKVDEFKNILLEIEKNLNRLKDLADKESDHENLANEIRSRVEAFEHGLCLLAPEFKHEDVGKAHDFFVGRKQELNRLRGIHKTIEIDFYSTEE